MTPKALYLILFASLVTFGCTKQTNVSSGTDPATVPSEDEAPADNAVDQNSEDTAQEQDTADTDIEEDTEEEDDDDEEEEEEDTEETIAAKKALTYEPYPGVVCPKYYTSSYDTDTYERWQSDITNGVRCSDGKIYCFGDNQKPQLIPKKPDGYECQHINGLGDEDRFKYEPDELSLKRMSQDSGSRVRYPFCDNGSTVRGVVLLSFSQSQYVWVCNDDECICGGKPCKYGNQCYNEQCIESKYNWHLNENGGIDDYDTDEEETDDICSRSNEGWNDEYVYYHSKTKESDDSDDSDEDSDQYKCGKQWIKKHSNMTCIPHPKGDIIKYDFCLDLTDQEWKKYKELKAKADEDEDDSDNKQFMELLNPSRIVDTPHGLGGKLVPWNLQFEKCLCGKETCAEDTACYKNKCVDLANLKPLPKGFTWKLGRPYCDKDKCKCGKEQCHSGQWCIEDRCFDSRDVMKIDNKYIQYGFYEYSGPMEIDHYFDKETQQALPRDHFVNMNNLPWLDIVIHRDTALCDDPDLPKDLNDYQCIVVHSDNGCGEGIVDEYAFYGWHCMKDEGCDCGNNRCAKNARCYHGQCLYDSVYLAMSCGADIRSWGLYAKADEQGWCKCGVSHTPPNMAGYLCSDDDGDGRGMKCWLKDGCACGEVSCKYGAFCIEPGKCLDSLDK